MLIHIGAYPWDIIGEGEQNALDRIHGEWGASGVTVWAASPPALYLRTRGDLPKLVRHRGGFLFPPSTDPNAASRLKPRISSALHPKDILRRVVESCAERSLNVRVMISASKVGEWAHNHPDMACKNVCGIPSESDLCLSNPDVQALLYGLIADLSAMYPLQGIVITDFESNWSEAWSQTLELPFEQDRLIRSLLAICFCESCRQGASHQDVDVQIAERSVQQVLRGIGFDAHKDLDSRISAFRADPLLRAYSQWRVRSRSDLYHRLESVSPSGLTLRWNANRQTRLDGEPLLDSAASATMTALDDVEQVPDALQTTGRHELALSSTLVARTGEGRLLRIVDQARQLGFVGIQLDHYGAFPEPSVDGIKQAIRFARRAAH